MMFPVNHAFTWKSTGDLDTCKHKCDEKPACVAIDHDGSNMICKMSSTSGEIVNATTSTYYDKIVKPFDYHIVQSELSHLY